MRSRTTAAGISRRRTVAIAIAGFALGATGIVAGGLASSREWEGVQIDCATFKADAKIWNWGLTGYRLPPDLERPAERQFAGVLRCNSLLGLTERQISERYAEVWTGDASFDIPPTLRMSPTMVVELAFGARGRVTKAKATTQDKPYIDLPSVNCKRYRFDRSQWRPGATSEPELNSYRQELAGLVRCGDLLGLTTKQLSRKLGGGRLGPNGANWSIGRDSFNDYVVAHISPLSGQTYDVTALPGD